MKKEEKRYLWVFLLSLISTILIHYFLISNLNLHPTIHVIISLIILWIFLAIFALTIERRKK